VIKLDRKAVERKVKKYRKENVLKEKAKREELNKIKNNYAEYCIYSHRGNWILGEHLKLVCSNIEDLIFRKIKENILIISMPPQHGKSQCVTETLPSYYLGKFPSRRVIEVSYGDDLAQRFGRRNKEKILEFGKELFNIELSKTSDTDFEIKEHKGSMISKGIMAGLTGNPGDLIIIDDPIKNRQEAESETYRNRIWEEFLNSIYTRLSADGVIILIMTRWHEDDLAGRLLANMPNKCKEINIPLEAEENDILNRNIGDSLFPQIGKDNNWLKEFKAVYTTQEGSRSWNALMQGRPTAQEGNMIKRNWWKYYMTLPTMIQTVMSVDATFKDSDTSDCVAIQIWGKREADMYLINSVNERMDFPTTVQTIIDLKAKYPNLRSIFIEDKANGSAIISVLRRKIPGIIPIQPDGGKVARVNAISGAIEAGNVYLPSEKQFTFDFVDQCSKFPNGTHDDMVDAMSQALNRFMYFTAGTPKPQQHYNFPSERPQPNTFTGGEATTDYINYNGGY
jgi:predicted phage terminase large subunit-like protein